MPKSKLEEAVKAMHKAHKQANPDGPDYDWVPNQIKKMEKVLTKFELAWADFEPEPEATEE